MKIDLIQYRAPKSTSFSGRHQGEEVRKKIALHEYDRDKSPIDIVIPKDTTSINPSFFLGLLYDSIKLLGVEEFKKKYKFRFDTDRETLKKALQKNIDDGMRNAINSLGNFTALSNK